MKKFFNARLVILIAILTLAAILRFWNLGNVPPSASMDEASIGYNAYSVLKTGGDEYGEFPLISQRGFDDWRRSTYLFLTVPFIALFGLNVTAVRIPAVILSVLTVLATYFLAKELFPKSKQFSIFNFQFSIGEIAVFLLAISPWHIYISRLGHESNAGLAFLIFGVLFFLKGQKNRVIILLSMIFFTLSIVSYYSGQAFIPLFIVGLFFIFRKNLLAIVFLDKKIFFVFFVFAILLIFVFKVVFSQEALVRFQGTSIFNPGATWQESSMREQHYKDAIGKNDLLGKIIYSEKIYNVKLLAKGYLSHFNIKWLFINSGNEPFKIPGFGLLYIWELPLVLVGIKTLIFMKEQKISKQLIILWFLISPIPAAMATGSPHAMRTYLFLPTWQIFSALGLYSLYEYSVRIHRQRLFVFIFSLIMLISIVSLFRQYFTVFPKVQSSSFQYAMSKAVPFVLANEKSYNKIVFSNQENLYQSYMLFLFHSRYDPSLYQKLGGTKSGGFAETHVFDKYEFKTIEWKNEKLNRLYVGNINDFPQNIESLKTFSNLDNTEVIKIVEK